MRYFLNVYRTGFVYIGLRFYTGWVVSGRRNEAASGQKQTVAYGRVAENRK